MGKVEELIDEKIKYWERQDEKSSCYHKEAGLFINIALSDMRKLKSSLPTQKDKVVVPQCVDKFLSVGNKSQKLACLVSCKYSILTCDMAEGELKQWLREISMDDLLSLANGYTVEKEQLYYVEIPLPNKVNGCGRLGQSRSGGLEVLYTKISLEPKWKTQFTENEIKAIDKRYWAFAVPVEEDE